MNDKTSEIDFQKIFTLMCHKKAVSRKHSWQKSGKEENQ